jgi:hypothetical protein
MSEEALCACWARDGDELWPASLLEITEAGYFRVSFAGWGARHNRLLPPTTESGEPSVVFEEPRRQRQPPPPPPLPHEISSPRTTTERKRPRPPQSPRSQPRSTSRSPPAARRMQQSTTASSRRRSLTAAFGSASAETLPSPRLLLKIPMPLDLECAACTGRGVGAAMVRCRAGGDCSSWVHRGCVGLAEETEAGEEPIVCPQCVPAPSWSWTPSAPVGTATRKGVDPTAAVAQRPAEVAAAAAAAGVGATSDGAAAREGGSMAWVGEERLLLQLLYDDRVMHADVRKLLRRFGVSMGRVGADLRACV